MSSGRSALRDRFPARDPAAEGRPPGSGPAGAVPPARWRILRDPPASAAWNMAVDEALARCAVEDEGVLRIYRWSRPSLSLGRNQPGRGRYDPPAIRSLGGDVVRRPTGGREVLHDRELTYAVVLPVRALGGLRATFRIVSEALVQALRSLGVDARTAEASRRGIRPDAGACFRELAPGEVEVGGRKLVGSAQVRVGRTLLQHGSLLLGAPSLSIAAFRLPSAPAFPVDPKEGEADPDEGASGPPAVGGDAGGVSLAELLSRSPAFPTVAAAVESAMAGAMGGRWGRGGLSEEEMRVARSRLPHYRSDRWTWIR